CSAQPEPCWRGPLQDDKLLAEKCRFGLASRMRSEQSDEQSAEQLQEVNIPKARIAHRGICASLDTIFGSHRKISVSWMVIWADVTAVTCTCGSVFRNRLKTMGCEGARARSAAATAHI